MSTWQPFVAALKELYEFAVDNLAPHQATKSSTQALPQVLAVPIALPLLHRREPLLLSEKSDTRSLLTQVTAYVTVAEAKVFARPVWAFDSVLTTIPYGVAVQVHGFQGRFAEISYQAVQGWIHKDAISENKDSIWPSLKHGATYGAEVIETTLLRRLLRDEFFAAELYMPLQPQEFIMYALLTRKQSLPSTSIRPRLPGMWHEVYKGKPGVTIGLQPKTGSVIEAFLNEHESFIGLVVAVHVDESIVVESVGREAEGCYRVDSFSKSDWQVWRPVFIQFT
jgi:hypothetical protein